MSLQDDVLEIRKAMANFGQAWESKVQPRLAVDPRLPAQFIIDVLNATLDGVMGPVFELEATIQAASSQGGRMSVVMGPVGMLLFGSGLSSSINESARAADVMHFIYDRQLQPLATEAHQAMVTDAKAMVPVVTSGSGRLDQVILTTFQQGITAITALDAVREDGNLLFKIGDAILSGAKSIISAMEALGAAVAAGATGLYTLFKTLIMVAKVAAIGAAGYVGYRLYTEYRGQRSLGAGPRSNPPRRRRRYR